MYQVSGESLLRAWLAEESDPEARLALLDWLPQLAADPPAVAAAVQARPGVPAYVARVPGTHIFVDYAVVEQYRTVLITGIHTVRWDMGEFDID